MVIHLDPSMGENPGRGNPSLVCESSLGVRPWAGENPEVNPYHADVGGSEYDDVGLHGESGMVSQVVMLTYKTLT